MAANLCFSYSTPVQLPTNGLRKVAENDPNVGPSHPHRRPGWRSSCFVLVQHWPMKSSRTVNQQIEDHSVSLTFKIKRTLKNKSTRLSFERIHEFLSVPYIIQSSWYWCFSLNICTSMSSMNIWFPDFFCWQRKCFYLKTVNNAALIFLMSYTKVLPMAFGISLSCITC